MRTHQILFIILISSVIAGCVTVKLDTADQQEHQKARNVKFKAPDSMFSSEVSDQLDQLWINKNNGNSISFVSHCSQANDQSLNSIKLELLSKLDSPRVLSNKYVPFNQRKALRTRVLSNTDGYNTKIEMLIHKKNSCVFILNYVANEKSFDADLQRFENFITSFVVP